MITKLPPSPAQAGQPLLITYAEAAHLLGRVSVRHIERLVAAKKLKAKGKGRARRIVHGSLLAYIESGDD